MKAKPVEYKIFNRNNALSLFVSVFMGLISGCANNDYSDLRAYIGEVHARPKGAIEPLPEIKVVETFIFKPDGLRDPFRPVEKIEEDDGFSVAGEGGIRPDKTRHKEELESFSLETLSMVGTMAMKTDLWGLVRVSDGSGTVHHVQVGNYMGRNYGKVTRIKENVIELMEIIPVEGKPGHWKEQQASLKLTE